MTLRPVTSFAAVLLLSTHAHALTISLDYGHDTATDNFFNTHPVAKASLEQARNNLQAAITTVLGAMPNDTYAATVGGATASYDFNLSYTNPSTGVSQTITTSTMNLGEVRIFVGVRELSGSTLGQGGPGGMGLSAGGSASNVADWPAAVNAANANAQTERLRAGGPTVNVLTGPLTLGGFTGNINVSYGAAVGNLWFDNDTNNDSLPDTDLQLNAFWHFDATTGVAAGKNDFYSVAMHEMLHALGIGASQSWTDDVSGTNWLGSNVAALLGSGNGAVDGGGGHIAGGLMSPRLADGVMQESLMSPSLLTGTRKELTQLDLAFLRDIGWQTIPEPSTAAMAVAFLTGISLRRRRQA